MSLYKSKFRDLAEKFRTELQSCSISRYGSNVTFINNGAIDENYSRFVTLRIATSNRQAEFDWIAFAPAEISNSVQFYTEIDFEVDYEKTISKMKIR